MRARYLGTDPWRNKDLAPRPVPDLHRKALGIGRIRVDKHNFFEPASSMMIRITEIRR